MLGDDYASTAGLAGGGGSEVLHVGGRGSSCDIGAGRRAVGLRPGDKSSALNRSHEP